MEEADRIIGRYKGRHHGDLIVAFGAMHGNEPAGVQALDMVFHMLNVEPRQNPSFDFIGQIIGVKANARAEQQNKRFLSKDLNRQWTQENVHRVMNCAIEDLQNEDLELRELIDLINKEIKDYQPRRLIVLDLHTTTADGIFSIATDELESIKVAKAMHAPVITGMLSGLKGTTLHYFNSTNFPCPTISVTFEAGQHNDPLSTRRAIAATINLLRSVGCVRPEDVENRHDTLLINYSQTLPKVATLLNVHSIQPEDKFEMQPGFKNFQPIEAGELLAYDRSGPIFASADASILMPLYQKQGEDGFFLIKVLEA